MAARADGDGGPGAASSPALALVGPSVGADEMRRLVAANLAGDRDRRLRFLLGRLPSREDAEDVLQDFAIKALQGARRLGDPRKIDAWLNVSLRNALFDRYRREGARRRLQQGVAAEPDLSDIGDRDEDIDGPMACMSLAINELKPAYADLIRRAELRQTPLKVVAGDLDLTANNVAVRLHRAREALRRTMHAHCAACPAPCAFAGHFLARRVG